MVHAGSWRPIDEQLQYISRTRDRLLTYGADSNMAAAAAAAAAIDPAGHRSIALSRSGLSNDVTRTSGRQGRRKRIRAGRVVGKVGNSHNTRRHGDYRPAPRGGREEGGRDGKG